MTTFYGVGYEKITVSTTVVALDSDQVAVATRAVFVVEAADDKHFRFRYDGTDPDASTGTPVADGQSFVLAGRENLENFRAIRADDTDVTLHVSYESPRAADIP